MAMDANATGIFPVVFTTPVITPFGCAINDIAIPNKTIEPMNLRILSPSHLFYFTFTQTSTEKLSSDASLFGFFQIVFVDGAILELLQL
jgi:hypothetical protein